MCLTAYHSNRSGHGREDVFGPEEVVSEGRCYFCLIIVVFVSLVIV